MKKDLTTNDFLPSVGLVTMKSKCMTYTSPSASTRFAGYTVNE